MGVPEQLGAVFEGQQLAGLVRSAGGHHLPIFAVRHRATASLSRRGQKKVRPCMLGRCRLFRTRPRGLPARAAPGAAMRT